MSDEMYPCSDCGKLRTKAEGGTVFTVCDSCWDKHYPKEAMTKTKDNLIADMAIEEEADVDSNRVFWFQTGASRMYDHRQKEIDELNQRITALEADAILVVGANEHDAHVSRAWSEAEHEANRWWAQRWIEYCWLHEACRTTEELMANKVRYREVSDEMDAAAARVMDSKTNAG